MNHIPEYSKSVGQRQKRQELDIEMQKMNKRISMLKYDVKKLTSKVTDDWAKFIPIKSVIKFLS